jgi:hypothetical protein
MINKNKKVPDNTIALIPNQGDNVDYSDIIFKPDKKRSWFTPHFYRCLPLTIANQYGFLVAVDYDFSVTWNGGDSIEDLVIERDGYSDNSKISIDSHFGSGIFTVGLPFVLRTPPGINLMTINPPNYIIPNSTVMSGSIETDNLRHNFTINIKVQIPDLTVKYKKGAPIAAIMPVQRYFPDSFDLKNASDIFDKNTVDEEKQSIKDFSNFRKDVEPTLKNHVNRFYFLGKDVYGNDFPDHQKP